MNRSAKFTKYATATLVAATLVAAFDFRIAAPLFLIGGGMLVWAMLLGRE